MDFSKFRFNSGFSEEIVDEAVESESVESESNSSLEDFFDSSRISSVSEGEFDPVNPLLDDGEEGEFDPVNPLLDDGEESEFDPVNPLLDDGEESESDGGVVVVGLPESVELGGEGGRVVESVRVGRVERNRERVREREVERLRGSGGSVVYGGRDGFENGVVGGVGEFLVDERGRVVGRGLSGGGSEAFDKLVRGAEVGGKVRVDGDFVERVSGGSSVVVGDESVRGSVVYPWSGGGKGEVVGESKGKISGGELSVFRNLGKSKSVLVDDEKVLEALRGVGGRSRVEVEARRVLGGRVAVGGKSGFGRGRGGGLKEKDLDVLKFLAKFKYASAKHLGFLSGVKERTSLNRLKRLRGLGLVDELRIWGVSSTWFLTSSGMVLSGFDLPLVREVSFSYMLVPHQFAVNHVAANLWGGGVNVLGLEDFPVANRVDGRGRRVFGEVLVSETEILSSFSRFRQMSSSEVYRPAVLDSIKSGFDEWESLGGSGAGFESPEFERGNEFMWMLWPGAVLGLNYHVPDLVVRRARAGDGEPESIAVEVELDNKARERYKSTLLAYLDDKKIFKKVVWVCKSPTVASYLETVSKEIGLWQEGRIDIVPILTEDGIFDRRDLWTI